MEVEDDGRTVASMDFESLTGKSFGFKIKPRLGKFRFEGVVLSRKERWAMIKAAMFAVIPIALAFGGLFFLAFILMDLFWLR